jgi:CPA1 family monovalent cation:H+ antiporter
MLEEIEIILGLLVIAIGLVALARKLQVPYPILLVVGGLLIGFIPGLPKIELEPDLVFLLFLPPILQLAAYYTPIRDFRANLGAIGLLAIGLVLFTMVVVALIAHAIIPDLPWAAAFVLGAIVAPPDAVAATSIAERLNLPRRMVTVLEGESLLNDATSLVAYRVAVAAILTGSFSLLDAGLQFLVSATVGVAIGLAVGFLITPIFRRLTEDIPVYIIFTFLSGYIAYLLAESVHVSSVLAVVALGIFYSQPRFNTMTAELRLQATPVWDIVVFLLNGFIFILIGLQLGRIIERLDGQVVTLGWYAVAICLAVIVARMVWMFPGAYLPRLPRKIRQRDPFPPWKQVLVVGWTGMRGVVSLAAALALPLTIQGGQPFPQRDLIIFLTFCVILATLVVQGLTLPWLIRKLKIKDDGGAEREEHKARLKAAYAGRARLNELANNNGVSPIFTQKLSKHYDARIRRFSARYHGEPDDTEEEKSANYKQLEEELLKAEMGAILQLRNEGIINDEVLRRVQYDLDLELLRLRDP